MSDTKNISPRIIDRRTLLGGAGVLAALGSLPSLARAEEKSALTPAAGAPPPAPAVAAAPTPAWKEMLNAILGDAKPVPGKIQMDLPEIAENGNTVPFNFTVESEMNEADFVKKLHIISTANPLPLIGSFEFTALSGKALVSSRMRLGRTQDVVAVAEMNDGKFYMATKTVKVTIGGCGG